MTNKLGEAVVPKRCLVFRLPRQGPRLPGRHRKSRGGQAPAMTAASIINETAYGRSATHLNVLWRCAPRLLLALGKVFLTRSERHVRYPPASLLRRLAVATLDSGDFSAQACHRN